MFLHNYTGFKHINLTRNDVYLDRSTIQVIFTGESQIVV